MNSRPKSSELGGILKLLEIVRDREEHQLRKLERELDELKQYIDEILNHQVTRMQKLVDNRFGDASLIGGNDGNWQKHAAAMRREFQYKANETVPKITLQLGKYKVALAKVEAVKGLIKKAKRQEKRCYDQNRAI
jgi:hypothetical protein